MSSALSPSTTPSAREISDQLAAVNTRLETVKEQAREGNAATLESDLANLRATEARHDPAIAPLCDEYLTEKAAKAATEQRRKAARTALDQHRQAAFQPTGSPSTTSSSASMPISGLGQWTP